MKDKKSILEYLYEFKKIWKNENIIEELTKAKDMILEVNKNNGKIFIFGNGGSLSIADHFAVDMTKNASVSTLSLGNSSMITCLSNDYGYDKWISKSIEYYVNDNDLVILISSSGSSLNIINAANICNERKIDLITFSGFDSDNKLKQKGILNFWVNSRAYNVVENIHQIWLLTIVDMIIGKSEYPAS